MASSKLRHRKYIIKMTEIILFISLHLIKLLASHLAAGHINNNERVCFYKKKIIEEIKDLLYNQPSSDTKFSEYNWNGARIAVTKNNERTWETRGQKVWLTFAPGLRVTWRIKLWYHSNTTKSSIFYNSCNVFWCVDVSFRCIRALKQKYCRKKFCVFMSEKVALWRTSFYLKDQLLFNQSEQFQNALTFITKMY